MRVDKLLITPSLAFLEGGREGVSVPDVSFPVSPRRIITNERWYIFDEAQIRALLVLPAALLRVIRE